MGKQLRKSKIYAADSINSSLFNSDLSVLKSVVLAADSTSDNKSSVFDESVISGKFV